MADQEAQNIMDRIKFDFSSNMARGECHKDGLLLLVGAELTTISKQAGRGNAINSLAM